MKTLQIETVGLSKSACRSKSRSPAPVAISRGEQAHPELSATIKLYRAMEMSFWLTQAEAALAHEVYLYYWDYSNLPHNNTTIVVVVRFGLYHDSSENNFIMTAYQIRQRRR
jgi:hypothetical protein